MRIEVKSRCLAGLLCLAVAVPFGCATTGTQPDETRTTARDKTRRGAGIGAAAGAVLGAVLGERKADSILKGAAIGAGIGAGVGAYMDSQEEKLAHIPGTSVERLGDDLLLVHFESDVLFDIDSAMLIPEARDVLDEAAQVFREFPKTAIVVQGHTDATGTEMHNQELSELRARSVARYLTDRGVEAGRITAVGYGEGNPIASNDTESGRSRNRRVDLLLKAKAR